MSKYKEWYINPVCNYICEVNKNGIGLSGNEIHVVEKKAVTELEEKIKKMKQVIADEDLGCADCVEAKADGYTICGDCSCD